MVTGATGFLGFHLVGKLLQTGATVTALVQPDRQEVLGVYGDALQTTIADVWNRASLMGRARNHDIVIHLVGSTHVDPKRGLTYDHVNSVSARHVIAMAVSDGVPHVILLSTVVRPLELPGAYVRSKRDAENYLKGTGIGWTIFRAPALYPTRSGPLMPLISLFARVFPLGLLTSKYAPLSADVAANGITGLALAAKRYDERFVYAGTIRREARRVRRLLQASDVQIAGRGGRSSAETEDVPFGWLPPSK